MNKNLLMSYMKLHGDSQKNLAESMGLSLSRLNAKINQYHGADFTQSEITFIKERYEMTNDDVASCFFTQKVSKNDTIR